MIKAVDRGVHINGVSEAKTATYTTSYYGHSSDFYLSQWAEFNNIKIDSNSFSAQLLENVANYLGINKSDEE